MCAKDTSTGTVDPESREVRPRISGEAAQQLQTFAERNDMTQSEAAEHLIKLATGATSIGTEISSINSKLDRVLEGLQAPGVASPVEEDGLAADGATTAKLNYDELSPGHSEPIAPDESNFEHPSVVKHTPRTRVPVMRGILLHEDVESLPERELLQRLQSTFGCSQPTAEGYVEHGMHRSWYPNPERGIESPQLLEEIKSELKSHPQTDSKRIDKCSSISELMPETVETTGGEVHPVWDPSSEIYVDERLYRAKLTFLLSRLSQFLQDRPKSGKTKLLLVSSMDYARAQAGMGEKVQELRAELSEEGIQLPESGWYQ